MPRFPWLKVAAAFAALGLHAVVLAMVMSSPVVQVAPGRPEALDVQFVELEPANSGPPAAGDSQARAVPDPVPVAQPAPEAKPKPRPKPIHRPGSAPPARTRAAPIREARPVHAASPSLAAAGAALATRSDAVPAGPATQGQPRAADPDRPRVVGRVDYLNKRPAPVYPRLSERRGEQGRVVLRVLISPRGMVADVKIQHSSGYARLDEAAVQAMRQARFRPYTENGIAYPAQVDIPFDFVL